MVKIGTIFNALEDLDADACIKKMFHVAVVQEPAAGRLWTYATYEDIGQCNGGATTRCRTVLSLLP